MLKAEGKKLTGTALLPVLAPCAPITPARPARREAEPMLLAERSRYRAVMEFDPSLDAGFEEGSSQRESGPEHARHAARPEL